MMNRRTFLLSLAAATPLLGNCALAFDKHSGDDDDDDHGHGHGHDHGHDHGHGHGHGHDHGHRYFQQQDYGAIESYYRGPRDLPPGLRKKLYRTGTLPPGWEKRFEPFPPALIYRLPPPPPNCAMGYLDGRAIVYNRKTRVILDSIDIAAALSGH